MTYLKHPVQDTQFIDDELQFAVSEEQKPQKKAPWYDIFEEKETLYKSGLTSF